MVNDGKWQAVGLKTQGRNKTELVDQQTSSETELRFPIPINRVVKSSNRFVFTVLIDLISICTLVTLLKHTVAKGTEW